ncbi:MAG: hypothetical protein K9J16_11200 [Melioribacteraceae bacterium]|nr:hypothetical protein [Melioribacteraceae bacterium]MCF8353576.1 hypothetical protein [Melioribacteraceae bacterium]MCF8393499.1 hypothetical protein [Melioribacteraceae bacterium]MCF8419309.1 hypothetical protein [Melioribacteraceae bacterium]
MSKYYFDHEKLKVYQKALEFVAWEEKLKNNFRMMLTKFQFSYSLSYS